VLLHWATAEIKPFEPETGNAGVGNKKTKVFIQI
jgi:hypothetical protein